MLWSGHVDIPGGTPIWLTVLILSHMLFHFQAGGWVTTCPKQEVGSPHIPALGTEPPQRADDDAKLNAQPAVLTSDGGQFQRCT